MKHLSQEELTDAYYGDLPPESNAHLLNCQECRVELARLKELLDAIRSAETPARPPSYGREVWARLESSLPAQSTTWWRRRWVLAPAAAAVLAASFLGGMLTVQIRNHGEGHQGSQLAQPASSKGLSDEDRRRFFLAAMSDHLDRSEILLAQLVNGNPAEADVSKERARARDLLDENRLLRETASLSGDEAHAALLSDLERVFLDLANMPGRLSPSEMSELRRRVEDQQLLFKVRVTSAHADPKGQI